MQYLKIANKLKKREKMLKLFLKRICDMVNVRIRFVYV